MTTTKTRKPPAPIAHLLMDDAGAVVTKTHDVEAAREAILHALQTEYAYDDDEALELLEPYLECAPTLSTGRWVWAGSYEGEPARSWRDAPATDRGVTRAVVWTW